MHGGSLIILFQPSEFIIILGAAIGSVIIGYPPSCLKKALAGLKHFFKGKPYTKKDYMELLLFSFNTFKLIGIFELNDETVSFPPCNLSTTISFEKRDLNGFERIDITGETILNDFQASVFNLDESRFTTDDFTLTSQSGLPYELTFEAQFVQLIANANVTYTLEGNILTITNDLLARKLKLVLLQ